MVGLFFTDQVSKIFLTVKRFPWHSFSCFRFWLYLSNNVIFVGNTKHFLFQSRSVDKQHAVITVNTQNKEYKLHDLGTLNGVSIWGPKCFLLIFVPLSGHFTLSKHSPFTHKLFTLQPKISFSNSPYRVAYNF